MAQFTHMLKQWLHLCNMLNHNYYILCHPKHNTGIPLEMTWLTRIGIRLRWANSFSLLLFFHLVSLHDVLTDLSVHLKCLSQGHAAIAHPPRWSHSVIPFRTISEELTVILCWVVFLDASSITAEDGGNSLKDMRKSHCQDNDQIKRRLGHECNLSKYLRQDPP